ncbi:unnamed protein product [Dibothriocephalus latus]|uniref:Uncharacterized protein n=1 Tax=Dibothriocephalus latus TaxID=60516 RepID=A0A3P6PRE2_DIBLA|nr:unnamed protein product [Dibothriocephalus latus]
MKSVLSYDFELAVACSWSEFNSLPSPPLVAIILTSLASIVSKQIRSTIDQLRRSGYLKLALDFHPAQGEVCLTKTTPVKDSLGSGHASPSSHPLSKEVSKVCGKRIDIFRKFLCSDADGLDCSSNGWNVFAQQDDMKIYNMEMEDADAFIQSLKLTFMLHVPKRRL